MKIAALVSAEEYLASVYEPDCDLVDGRLEDRNVGEKNHSKLQFAIQLLLSRIPNIWIFPEVRIQVAPTRFRVPDIAVYLEEPPEQVFTSPPFLTIEILSPEDRWSRTIGKLDEYLAMGCSNIWVFDPGILKAYRYDGRSLTEVCDYIDTVDLRISVPLSELWRVANTRA